jgi:hypothetical protein
MLILNHFLAPSIGALIVFILVLYKGDICPGQRGRLHKWLPVILAGLLVSSLYSVLFLVPSGLLGYFLTHVKTAKTRGEGPRQLLISVVIYSSFTAIYLIAMNNSLSTGSSLISWLFCGLVLGLSLAHLLLTLARTRLDSFHQLLPVLGVGLSILYLVVMLGLLYFYHSSIEFESQTEILHQLLISLPLLVLGLVIWCWHLFRHIKPQKFQLSISFIILSFSFWGMGSILTL